MECNNNDINNYGILLIFMFNFLNRIFHREIENKPPASLPPEPKGSSVSTSNQKGAKYVQQEALDQALLNINTRLDSSNLIMTILIGALVICFITLFYGYWQFATTSYNNFSQRIKELNDQRYQFQQTEIEFLQKIATTSSKIGQ